MRFGSVQKITQQMLRTSQEQAVRIFGDLWNRLEELSSNINFDDNFKGRTVTLDVTKNVVVEISATKPDFVLLKRFILSDLSLVPVSWNWRKTNAGLEIIFTWSGDITTATTELFIGEK